MKNVNMRFPFLKIRCVSSHVDCEVEFFGSRSGLPACESWSPTGHSHPTPQPERCGASQLQSQLRSQLHSQLDSSEPAPSCSVVEFLLERWGGCSETAYFFLKRNLMELVPVSSLTGEVLFELGRFRSFIFGLCSKVCWSQTQSLSQVLWINRFACRPYLPTVVVFLT
jgi:hypothetical protein